MLNIPNHQGSTNQNHTRLTRMANIKKTVTRAGDNGEKLELHTLLVGM
jgi:hypothetical protein